AVRQPVLAYDCLAVHRRDDGVPAPEGHERERSEQHREAGERSLAHAVSPSLLPRGHAQITPSGPSTATTARSDRCSTCTATNAAAASSSAPEACRSGLPTLTPMASVMAAAAATAPRSAESSAGSCR